MIYKMKIMLNSVNKIQQFVEQAKRFSGTHIDVLGTNRRVDGRSIIGIFSLDTSVPLTLEVEYENSDEASLMFGKWEVKNGS